MVEYIKDHPFQALILAFAIGAIAATLFGVGGGFDDSYLH